MRAAIFIDESQRDLLRIVWKDSIDDSIKMYRMNRVVYGTTCAPFLAQRVIKQLVTDDGPKYPLAASAVSADIFMDDPISGCSSISSAKQLKQELISLFSGAGMQLHKWSSNCIELLSNFDVSDGDVSLAIPDETKALGLLWRPQKDTLAFSVSSIADVSDSSTITKRSVLSATARIFDPLDLISLVVTKAKLVMQELWRLELDWNDSLPIHMETQWKRFVKSLAAINNLKIPRYILLDDTLRIELHGYCDSSLRAYVLKPFVKNRVSVIQHLTEVSSWKHVQSPENPADIISRGIDPDKIQDCVLWWYGPSVLQNNPIVSPCDISEINNNDLYLREFKKSDPVCLITQNVELLPIINKCSSFMKLKRILVWCLRFKENARNPSSQRTIGSRTATKLSRALICLVRNVQYVHFPLEIQCLLKGKQIPNSSSLLNLSPVLDENSILRVVGKLKHSNLTVNQKHPMLIPNKGHISNLLINYYHVLHFHTDVESTIANIRIKYFIKTRLASCKNSPDFLSVKKDKWSNTTWLKFFHLLSAMSPIWTSSNVDLLIFGFLDSPRDPGDLVV
ncbi:integrase catalytic domain-containing protein [Trichonephila clavipes]|nr:integrase catalytic domain-containing protein [Trichonephila clavipes]